MITTDSPNEIAVLRDAINAKVASETGAEKARAKIAQKQIGKSLHAKGATSVDGLGQLAGRIDRRTFFRWHQEKPGCWSDPGFVDTMLRDNPQLRAPGYRAKKAYSPTSRTVYPNFAAPYTVFQK